VEVVLSDNTVPWGDFLANIASIIGGMFTMMHLTNVFSNRQQGGIKSLPVSIEMGTSRQV
jgi:hypothetical protein